MGEDQNPQIWVKLCQYFCHIAKKELKNKLIVSIFQFTFKHVKRQLTFFKMLLCLGFGAVVATKSYWKKGAIPWVLTLPLSVTSCCSCLNSVSAVDVGLPLLSNLSWESLNSPRSFLLSRSKLSFSVSNRSRFPHSAAFSACNLSSCCKQTWWLAFKFLCSIHYLMFVFVYCFYT